MNIRVATITSLCVAHLIGVEALAADFPPITKLIADCENQWVLHANNSSENLRMLGYVYVDPTQGFTIDLRGDVALDANGMLSRQENPLEGKARVIYRIASNNPVACLTDEQVEQLGLPRVWEFQENYQDDRPAGPHHTAWAFHYNHIGAHDRALEHAKLARAENYEAASLEFEHGFALNALEKCQDAAELLEPARRRYPRDIEIAAELAYAHLCLRQYPRAIEIYTQALQDDKKKTSTRRAEFAQNIAQAYLQLGDEKKAREWVSKANKWKTQIE